MRIVMTLIVAATLSLAAAQSYVFSITFDGGGWFDRSFNEGTWNGLTRAVNDLSAEYDIDVLVYNGTPETAADGQRSIASSGADLIVAAGFLQADSIQTVSSEFPETSFVLIDAVAENPNVRSILFREHEGSFLVGYLAGSLSQTGVVGFVGGMDVPLIRAFELGYLRGVEAACPSCTLVADYVGDTPAAWNDPAKAKELSASQKDRGADIIYAAAGASGNGVIEYVNEIMCYNPDNLPANVTLRSTPLSQQLSSMTFSDIYQRRCGPGSQPLFFIGVDSNQNYLGDTDGDPATVNHGLTSMLKRVDVAAETAAYDVVNGTFSGGIQSLGLAENGVGYAIDDYNRALIPSGVLEELALIRQRIVNGQLVVPDYRSQ